MASPTPPAPNEVPETAATYERTQLDPTLAREDATRPENEAAKPLPPSEQQQPNPREQLKQTHQQQHLQESPARSDDARPDPLPTGGAVKGSMKTEEPLGWDQSPTDIKDPRAQRHPRPDGVGGSEPDSAKRDPQR